MNTERQHTIAGAQVSVIGAARSGLAVAQLLRQKGASVFLSDLKPARPGVAEQLDAAGVRFEFGGHTNRALDADWIVISPGVPSTSPLVVEAQSIQIPVYAEIEVASWFCQAPIIAVTGSNGKTTTTSLLGHLFRQAGWPTLVAGNIGTPLSAGVAEIDKTCVVILEVSSFQLDHIDTFRPRISVLLNITPDHLDRYAGFGAYAESKFSVFRNQAAGDTVVFNHDDTLVRETVQTRLGGRSVQKIGFSLNEILETGGFLREQELVLHLNQTEEILMHAEQLALRGRHNVYNSLAASIAARVMDIRSEVIRESLTTFEGVPHRLELVREINGVQFVNDSKATNVNAVWYALESMYSQVVLIAGGRDKGNDYSMIKDLVQEKARGVVCIGESGDKVMQELGTLVPYACRAYRMEEAVAYAASIAQPGDVVLLSPACASFDMFNNYEERGDVFRLLVEAL